jgi:hypothetical protein
MSKKTARARSKRSSRPSKSSAVAGTAPTTPMHTDWWDVLRTLNDHGVRYLLIGGHAVSVHSAPRYTEDLDILVEPTRANGARLHRALVAFGLGSFAPRADELVRGPFWQFGRKPVRIDVLTEIPAIDFRKAWARRVEARYGDLLVPILGRADLIANKRAAGRPKDLVDAEALERAEREAARRTR